MTAQNEAATRVLLFVVTPARYQEETKGTELPPDQLILPYEVDLARLSPLARRIASGIAMTFGDTGMVAIRSHWTHEELVRRNPAPVPAGLTMDDYVAALAQTFGPGYLDSRPERYWDWPALDVGETPSAFLEREVRDMQTAGEILRVALELPAVVTTAEIAARLGISARQAQYLCAAGLLPSARKRGGVWVAQASDLELPQVQQRPKAGRPHQPRYYLAIAADDTTKLGAVFAFTKAEARKLLREQLAQPGREDDGQRWREGGSKVRVEKPDWGGGLLWQYPGNMARPVPNLPGGGSLIPPPQPTAHLLDANGQLSRPAAGPAAAPDAASETGPDEPHWLASPGADLHRGGLYVLPPRPLPMGRRRRNDSHEAPPPDPAGEREGVPPAAEDAPAES